MEENEREYEELRAGMALVAASGYIVAGLVVGVLGMALVALAISAALHIAGAL